MKSFEMIISPWHDASTVGGAICDNNRRKRGCTNQAETCLSRIHIQFDVGVDHDHYHICESCAKEWRGTHKEQEEYVYT